MKYERYAWRLAHRYYNPKSIHNKDDLFQIAMLGMIEQLARHPESSEPICITAMKCKVLMACFRELRPKRQAKKVPLETDNREIRALAGGENVEAEVLDRKAADTILTLVGQLPDTEFQLVVMRMNGVNISEVVRREGWQHSKVKHSLRNARKRLKSWLNAVEIAA